MARKTLSLVLALLMLLSATAALADSMDVVNLDSAIPVVKEGEKVTLTAVAVVNDTAVGPEEMFLWQYIEKKLNIDLEVTHILESAREERLSLMMASNTMPDLLFNFHLSNNQIARFGDEESLLLNMRPYINEELMPHLSAWEKKLPSVMSDCTTPTGSVYTLPLIRKSNPAFFTQYYTPWFTENNVPIPTTIEELLDALRQFKAQYPDSLPLGIVNYGTTNGLWDAFVEAAYGVVIQNGHTIFEPALKDGEVIIPAGHESYLNYLTFMHTCYEENLLSKDYYVMEETALKSMLQEDVPMLVWGRHVYAYYPTVADERIENWGMFNPLTSAVNDTPMIAEQLAVSGMGNFVVNAKTAYPEVAMRMADWFFSDDAAMWWAGPIAGSEDAFGNDGIGLVVDPETLDSRFVHSGCANYIAPAQMMGNWMCPIDHYEDGWEAKTLYYHLARIPDEKIVASMDSASTSGTQLFNQLTRETVASGRYYTKAFPNSVFMDADTAIEVSDLSTVLSSYMQTETAKFVTGLRSLDEFPQYLKELDSMGLQEYLGYYVEYYEGVSGN